MEFVGNYTPCGLSPQTDGMPVMQKKTPDLTWREPFINLSTIQIIAVMIPDIDGMPVRLKPVQYLQRDH